jgi:hypothetical protein
MRGAFRCLTSFQNDLLINLGKATNDFLKLDQMRNLKISSSRGLNTRGGPMPQCFGEITRVARELLGKSRSLPPRKTY